MTLPVILVVDGTAATAANDYQIPVANVVNPKTVDLQFTMAGEYTIYAGVKIAMVMFLKLFGRN